MTEPQTTTKRPRLFAHVGPFEFEWFGKAKIEGDIWIAEYNGKLIPLRPEVVQCLNQ